MQSMPTVLRINCSGIRGEDLLDGRIRGIRLGLGRKGLGREDRSRDPWFISHGPGVSVRMERRFDLIKHTVCIALLYTYMYRVHLPQNTYRVQSTYIVFSCHTGSVYSVHIVPHLYVNFISLSGPSPSLSVDCTSV